MVWFCGQLCSFLGDFSAKMVFCVLLSQLISVRFDSSSNGAGAFKAGFVFGFLLSPEATVSTSVGHLIRHKAL